MAKRAKSGSHLHRSVGKRAGSFRLTSCKWRLPLTQWIMQVALQSEADDLEQWDFLLNEPLLTSWDQREKKGDTWLSFGENLPRPMKRLVRTHSGHSKVAIDRPLTARFLALFSVWLSLTLVALFRVRNRQIAAEKLGTKRSGLPVALVPPQRFESAATRPL